MTGERVTIRKERILAHSKVQHRSSPGSNEHDDFHSSRQYSLRLVWVLMDKSVKLYGYTNLLGGKGKGSPLIGY